MQPGVASAQAQQLLMIALLDDEPLIQHEDAVGQQGVYSSYTLGGDGGARALNKHTMRWAPYRGYAALALWQTLGNT